jgi:YHS domain-containing protein
MKLLLLLTLSLFAISSCSHHGGHKHKSERKAAKIHMFNKRCALAVSKGNFNVKGGDKYVLLHDGKYYHFSSKKSMDEFKGQLNHNISKADMNWFRGNR